MADQHKNAAAVLPIYHLVPANYYLLQPVDQPYRSETLAQEGFIHCTSGSDIKRGYGPFQPDLKQELVYSWIIHRL
jgi:hypothetical protein